MKALILSDLHFEIECDYREIINQFPAAEVIIIAGDLLSYANVNCSYNILSLICQKYPQVIYVRGNHEYWGNSILIEKIFSFPNLHELINEKIIIQDIEFLGATMWFPETIEAIIQAKNFSDFRYIKNSQQIYDQNKKARELFSSATEKSIIISHHIPSSKSIHENYKFSSTNCFFISLWGETIIQEKQPRMWVHGHTHNSVDLLLGCTRIYCNPRGYPMQFNPKFKLDLIDL